MKYKFYRIIIVIFLCSFNGVAWSFNSSELFPNNYAVVVGVREYPGEKWSNLENAENDAKEIAAYFKGQGYQVKLFLTKQATKENIISYLEDELPTKLKQGDRIAIYFSGHGDTFRTTGRGYLIPYDGLEGKPSSWISTAKLEELSSVNEYAKHQLFILDACFGGDLATKSSKGDKKYVARHTSRVARQYLTAGKENQSTLAISKLKGYEQYSHYTAYLIKGLRDGYADIYRDGVITHGEISTYLESAAHTTTNTPNSGVLPGHEQGNFIFTSPLIPEKDETKRDIVGPVKGGIKDTFNQDDYDWNIFSVVGLDGLVKYLELHPAGKYVKRAEKEISIIKEENDWVSYSESGIGGLKQYVEKYPSGKYIDKAKVNIAKIQDESDWKEYSVFGIDGLRKYIEKNPGGIYRSDAEKRILELEAKLTAKQKDIDKLKPISYSNNQAARVWLQDVQYSTDPKTVQEYLNNYPNGPMTAKAQRKLKNLR